MLDGATHQTKPAIEVLQPIEDRAPQASPFGDVVLTSDELASWLCLTTEELRRMRNDGNGPPFVRFREQSYRYRLSDVRRWLDAQTLTQLPARPAKSRRQAA